MSTSHSICFQAGPYQRWTFSIDGFGCGDDGLPERLWVQLTTPDANGSSSHGHGSNVFLPATPGYQVMLTALNGVGREPFEKALTWILDQTAERLGEDDTIDSDLRAHWQPIVDAGRAARDEYQAKWGDEGEPAFQVIGALVVTVSELAGASL